MMINLTVERPKDIMLIAQLVNLINIHRRRLAELKRDYAHALFYAPHRKKAIMQEIAVTNGTIRSCLNCQELLIHNK